MKAWWIKWRGLFGCITAMMIARFCGILPLLIVGGSCWAIDKYLNKDKA